MHRQRRRSHLRAVAALAFAPVAVLAACAPAPPADPPPPAVATPLAPFDISIRPTGSIDPAVLAEFEAAAARWESVITADIADVAGYGARPSCLASTPTGPIDDVLINVQVVPISTPGVLGQAGFCERGPDGLPRLGVMVFDSEEVPRLMTSGAFRNVVLHEMGHVLGIGTTWPFFGLLDTSTSGDPRFVGANATAAWQELGDTGTVPVEATGGAGTALAHWRDTTFTTELMTGWIGSGSSPLSRVSIASLADLGYQVDPGRADPFVLATSLLAPALRVLEPQDLHERAFLQSSDEADAGDDHDGDEGHDHGGVTLITPEGPIGTD